MKDLIDRQAVLELPRNITRNLFGEIVEESIDVKKIEALPSVQPDLAQILAYECGKASAQPEPRWTPCNEGMPEATDYYLIQYSRRICPDEMAVAFYSVEEAELDKNYTWEFNPFADWKEVIAWMLLPKSYER